MLHFSSYQSENVHSCVCLCLNEAAVETLLCCCFTGRPVHYDIGEALIFSHSRERPDLWEDLRWDSLLIVTALKSVKTWGQRREADVTVQESPAVCSASPSKDLSAEKFGQTMWVDRAWNYYHHQFWMKKRKHIFHRKGGSFQFSCVVRTTRTIPQMISSTSKEFTFRGGNVPLLCPYTGFSQPKRRIVCLVSLFIIPSVHTTIVLNK